MTASPQAILPGFDDPVTQSQQTFRQALKALSRPGHIVSLTGPLPEFTGLSPAAAALCLTLLDRDTRVWLDRLALGSKNTLVFHCGCPVTGDPSVADFAIVDAASTLRDFQAFPIGSDEHPECAATLIIEVVGLGQGETFTLRGPGIDGLTRLAVKAPPGMLREQLAVNEQLFPRGLDMILTSGRKLAALPRSLRLEH